MRKLIIIAIAVLFLFSVFTAPAMAAYYQKINGANAGKIKWFKNNHPPSPSEWVLLEGYEPPGDDPCEGGCGDAPTFFNGEASQFSGANFERGNIKFDKDGFYKKGSGAMAYGTEGASAKYYGDGNGLGFGLALGATLIIGDDFTYRVLGYSGRGYYVAGGTGNVAAAGVFADGPACASIEGSGEFGTLAAANSGVGVGVASSNGKFAYQGSTPSGIVVGGGATIGGSAAGAGGNNVWAASGQITVSGVGAMDLCGGGCGFVD